MNLPLNTDSLANLIPVKELSEANRSTLVEKSELIELAPGSRISASREQAWLVYLVAGKLSLASMSSANGSLEEGAPRARLPVFADRANNDFAVAEAPSTLLRLDKALFSELLNNEHLSGYQVVADVEVNEAESVLFQKIYEAYQNKTLQLPPMPEVAMRIRKMANDPEVGVPELAKTIQMDAAVAGSIMHAANSPLFCGAAPVGNIRDGVVRLGLKTTQSVATSIAMRATFNVKSAAIKQHMQTLWQHSVNVSAISYVIARKYKQLDPDRALLAGLLHDIGVIPILHFLESSHIEASAQEISAAISKLRAMIGVLVLNAWDFDTDMLNVVEHAEDWMRDPGPQADYCDIVLVAQLYNAQDTPEATGLPPLQDVPAVKKLNLGTFDEEGHLAVLTEAETEIAEVKKLLDV